MNIYLHINTNVCVIDLYLFYILLGITDLHKGHISVYSPGEGLGSVFYLDLQCYRNKYDILSNDLNNGMEIISDLTSLEPVITSVLTPMNKINIENNKNSSDGNNFIENKVEGKYAGRTLRSGRVVGGPGSAGSRSHPGGPGSAGSRSPLSLVGERDRNSSSSSYHHISTDSISNDISINSNIIHCKVEKSNCATVNDHTGHSYNDKLNYNQNFDAQSSNNVVASSR